MIFFIFVHSKNKGITNLQNLTNIYNLKDFIIEEFWRFENFH
jgi:hypothetical protein